MQANDNCDGELNPGETAVFAVSITNHGAQSVGALQATLTNADGSLSDASMQILGGGNSATLASFNASEAVLQNAVKSGDTVLEGTTSTLQPGDTAIVVFVIEASSSALGNMDMIMNLSGTISGAALTSGQGLSLVVSPPSSTATCN